MPLTLTLTDPQALAPDVDRSKRVDTGTLVIGRDPESIDAEEDVWMFPDEMLPEENQRRIGRTHCIVRFQPETHTYLLIDHSTNNGVFLNGQRIDRGGAVRLNDGDRFTLCEPPLYTIEVSISVDSATKHWWEVEEPEDAPRKPSRPVNITPVSGEPPIAPTAPPPTDTDSALQFLRGAGLHTKRQGPLPPELFATLGQLLRLSVSGLLDLARTRNNIKEELGIPRKTEDLSNFLRNPGPFSDNEIAGHHEAAVTEALLKLLWPKPGQIAPENALSDSFRSIAVHESAMLAAIRTLESASLVPLQSAKRHPANREFHVADEQDRLNRLVAQAYEEAEDAKQSRV